MPTYFIWGTLIDGISVAGMAQNEFFFQVQRGQYEVDSGWTAGSLSFVRPSTARVRLMPMRYFERAGRAQSWLLGFEPSGDKFRQT
jgi:hypothetical protein